MAQAPLTMIIMDIVTIRIMPEMIIQDLHPHTKVGRTGQIGRKVLTSTSSNIGEIIAHHLLTTIDNNMTIIAIIGTKIIMTVIEYRVVATHRTSDQIRLIQLPEIYLRRLIFQVWQVEERAIQSQTKIVIW